jgi:hypothetical protein
MNANELAEWLIAFTQNNVDYEEKWIKDSAIMLRQQHDRLCLLENIVMDLKATVIKAQE